MSNWRPVSDPSHSLSSLDGALGKGTTAPAARLWLAFESSTMPTSTGEVSAMVAEAFTARVAGLKADTPSATITRAAAKDLASKSIGDVLVAVRSARDARLAVIAAKVGDDLDALSRLQELLQYIGGGGASLVETAIRQNIRPPAR